MQAGRRYSCESCSFRGRNGFEQEGSSFDRPRDSRRRQLTLPFEGSKEDSRKAPKPPGDASRKMGLHYRILTIIGIREFRI